MGPRSEAFDVSATGLCGVFQGGDDPESLWPDVPCGKSNGFEAFRRIHHELALQTRPEALALRMSVMNFAQKGDWLTDTVRLVEGEIMRS